MRSKRTTSPEEKAVLVQEVRERFQKLLELEKMPWNRDRKTGPDIARWRLALPDAFAMTDERAEALVTFAEEEEGAYDLATEAFLEMVRRSAAVPLPLLELVARILSGDAKRPAKKGRPKGQDWSLKVLALSIEQDLISRGYTRGLALEALSRALDGENGCPHRSQETVSAWLRDKKLRKDVEFMEWLAAWRSEKACISRTS